ncbi:unnamed protein product [Caenorhabditis bovis]|uniref:Uncharacterized protein n=1 Tax=Caenorhabditis bovis TaxID=2654633 RepID=A0A8S1F2F7_9PELO|nr:unnamed protein product [Caenorhabditis bovis]
MRTLVQYTRDLDVSQNSFSTPSATFADLLIKDEFVLQKRSKVANSKPIFVPLITVQSPPPSPPLPKVFITSFQSSEMPVLPSPTQRNPSPMINIPDRASRSRPVFSHDDSERHKSTPMSHDKCVKEKKAIELRLSELSKKFERTNAELAKFRRQVAGEEFCNIKDHEDFKNLLEENKREINVLNEKLSFLRDAKGGLSDKRNAKNFIRNLYTKYISLGPVDAPNPLEELKAENEKIRARAIEAERKLERANADKNNLNRELKRANERFALVSAAMKLKRN